MRYLPLEAADRQAMLAKIGVPAIDALFADVPADKLLKALPICPRPRASWKSSASCRGSRQRTLRPVPYRSLLARALIGIMFRLRSIT